MSPPCRHASWCGASEWARRRSTGGGAGRRVQRYAGADRPADRPIDTRIAPADLPPFQPGRDASAVVVHCPCRCRRWRGTPDRLDEPSPIETIKSGLCGALRSAFVAGQASDQAKKAGERPCNCLVPTNWQRWNPLFFNDLLIAGSQIRRG